MLGPKSERRSLGSPTPLGTTTEDGQLGQGPRDGSEQGLGLGFVVPKTLTPTVIPLNGKINKSGSESLDGTKGNRESVGRRLDNRDGSPRTS